MSDAHLKVQCPHCDSPISPICVTFPPPGGPRSGQRAAGLGTRTCGTCGDGCGPQPQNAPPGSHHPGARPSSGYGGGGAAP
eukprot:gene1054-2631_t